MHARVLKRRDTGGQKQPGQLLFRSGGVVPGRALGAVLDEADSEYGRRNNDGIGAVKSRYREPGGRRRRCADAEHGAGTAGRLRLLFDVFDRGMFVGRGRGGLACMAAMVAGMDSGDVVVM